MIIITVTIKDVPGDDEWEFFRKMETSPDGANSDEVRIGHLFMDVLQVLSEPEKEDFLIQMLLKSIERRSLPEPKSSLVS